MANRRISRTKSFASYVNSINQDVSSLKNQNAGGSISAGAISGENLSETVTLFGSSIQSNNYAPGSAGWKIDGTGVAEFADVYVRGDINAETGTIGYWNISPVDATRHIGTDRIFGTFLESAQIGINDDAQDSGVYVALYKTYFEGALPVTDCKRVANVATITVPGHTYQAGDYLQVQIDQDITFNAYPTAVRIDEVTEFTVSYQNTGADFPVANATTGILPSTAVTGTAQYFQKDSAGLFVRDYGKVDFDYGYFSSEGVKYSSGQAVNLLYNPSFEVDQYTPSLASWTITSGSGRTATNSAALFNTNYYPLISGSYTGWEFKISNTGYYTPTTDYIKGSVDFAAGKIYKVFGSTSGVDRELTFNADVYFSPTHQSMVPNGVTVTAANLVFTFASNPYALVGDMVYMDLDVWDYTVASPYYRLSTQKTGDRLFKVIAANTTSLTVTNPWNKLVAGAYIEDASSNRAATIYHIADGTAITAVSLTYANASVTTIMTLTVPNHGFSTNDVIYLDANIYDSDPDLSFNNFAEFGDPALSPTGRAFIVRSTTSTTVVVNVPAADYQPAAYTLTSVVSDSGYSRPPAIYSGKTVKYSFDSAKIEFPNGTTTSLLSVLTSASASTWTADKILIYTPDDYIAASVNKNVSMHKGVATPFTISSYALESKYKTLDPTGWAASSNFYIRLPLGFYENDGTTVLKAKSDSLPQIIRQTYDNIQLTTGTEFFFGGDGFSNSSWADETTIPSTYSIGAVDSWIDISVENGTSTIDHISALTFKPTGSTVLYNPASIAPIAPPSYEYSPGYVTTPGYMTYGQSTSITATQDIYLADSSMLTLEAGKSGYISPDGTLTLSGSYLSGVSGALASGMEMVAYKAGALASPISSIGVWVDNSNNSYASFYADKVYFRDSNDNKTLASDYRIASSGSLPQDEFGASAPDLANHVIYLRSATNISTAASSYTYLGYITGSGNTTPLASTKLGGWFRTGASGKSLVNFGMRVDHTTTGTINGNVEIRLGTDIDGLPVTNGTVISNYLAIPAAAQGTNLVTSSSSCLYNLLPHTTYYIAFGWYTSVSAARAYDRWIIVNQII